MSESTQTPLEASFPATANPAVAHCCRAHALALKAAHSKSKSEYSSLRDAQQAYRTSMPPLSGQDNIRDFIACVAHGILIDAITGPDGARLLYAAQVAYSALNAPTQKPLQKPAPAKLESRTEAA